MVLYDTMRKGSDYWRPGNLLTLAAQVVRDNVPHHAVSYARQDVLCPPLELLEQFRTTAMTFGEYATEYAAYLREGNPSPLSVAAGAVILAQLQGFLAAFYCTTRTFRVTVTRLPSRSVPHTTSVAGWISCAALSSGKTYSTSLTREESLVMRKGQAIMPAFRVDFNGNDVRDDRPLSGLGKPAD